MKRLILALCMIAMPASAFAEAKNDQSYHSLAGYSVDIPSGWMYINAANVQGMKSGLPENIDPTVLERADVLLVPNLTEKELLTTLKADDERIGKNNDVLKDNPEAPKEDLIEPVTKLTPSEKYAEYSPSITIFILDAIPEYSDQAPKAYEKAILKEFEDRPSFKGMKIVESTGNEDKSYVFKSEYQYHSRTITTEQHVLLFKDKTVIVTCSNDQNEYMRHRDWCARVAGSIEF